MHPSGEQLIAYFGDAFQSEPTDGLAESATQFVIDKYRDRERPYFAALRRNLQHGMNSRVAPGVDGESDIDAIVSSIAYFSFPLLEKMNCLLLYQRWARGESLVEAAEVIQGECAQFVSRRDGDSQYRQSLGHWKADLLAQLRRECGQKQVYAGFDTLVDLSWGNPRHLLILLKHVFAWATFRGEKPFGGSPISQKAQDDGVREAAEWFFGDARLVGRDGRTVQDSVNRLGTLFRGIRYSDKPAECSVSTFSYDPASVSESTQRLIELAEQSLLLVSLAGGQRDRNSERVDRKVQLNRMLAPRWDVAFFRRGAIALAGEEVDAVFDPVHTNEFATMCDTRVERMNAPFFGPRRRRLDDSAGGQSLLFGE